MSVLSSDVYNIRPSGFRFKRDAWLVGKFFANDIHSFTTDIDRIPLDFGRSIKTVLKLSYKGLTCGGPLQILDPSRAAPSEHINLERIYDLYQDRKYLNVLVCVLKSRIPEYNFEVYTYKLKKPIDVIEFQDSFTELVTGVPRKGYDHVDFRASTINLSDVPKRASSRSGVAYSTNGSSRLGTLRNAQSQPLLRSATSSFLQRRTPIEKLYVRRSRVHDVGVQVSRGRHGMEDVHNGVQLVCRRTKVYGSNNNVVADVSSMVSPSPYFDDFDGQAMAITGNNHGYTRGRAVEQEDFYRQRIYTPPSRQSPDAGSRISNSFHRRTGKEMQSRVLPISESGSSEEVHVQLSGRQSRTGLGQTYYHSQDYMENNATSMRRDYSTYGINGNVYGRRYNY